jgi:DNA polymerase III epsilon subunit-like protein
MVSYGEVKMSFTDIGVNLNGNLIASLDVETTGFVAGFHDIIQVAVVVLGSDLRPDKRVMPFYVNLKPKRPENIDEQAMVVTRMTYAQMMQQAVDPFDAADYFEDFVSKLREMHLLPEDKKIIPLGHNLFFDIPFLRDWLGNMTYDGLFHPWVRDTLVVAQFLNDEYIRKSEAMSMDWKVPFPKANLAYLCSCLKIKNTKAHDALGDAIATAEVYRRMVLRQIP